MSSETPESSAPQQPAPIAKKRNPVERVIVWTLIGLMLALVALEGRAQQGHTNTVRAMIEIVDEGDGLTVDQLEGCLKLFPVTSGPTSTATGDVYKYKWFSLLRSDVYELQVRVSTGKDDIRFVSGFGSPDPDNDMKVMMEAVKIPESAARDEPAAGDDDMGGGFPGGVDIQQDGGASKTDDAGDETSKTSASDDDAKKTTNN